MMRSFALTEMVEERPTILLLNGGGQQPYTKFHKATRLFKPFSCNIVSLELPGHGKSNFEKVVTAEDMIQDFGSELSSICSKYEKVGLFGYSLGGLLSLKAAELEIDDFLFVIAAGAAIRINKKQEDIMQRYTTVDFFEKMRWMKVMKEYHKDGWQALLISMSDMLEVGSPLFTNPEKLPSHIPIHLVLGDSDEVADYHLQEDINGPVKLHILENTSHFDYFARSWDKMQQSMSQLLPQYLDPKN